MTPGPSVVFTEFGSRNDPMLRGWLDFRAQVLAGARDIGPSADSRADPRADPDPERARRPVATPSGTPSGIWRLVASNHREVARSLFLYESLNKAEDHVGALQNDSDDLVVRLLKGPSAAQHGWLAESGDGAVISCGRWYSASSLSREAAEFSLQALRTASLPSSSRGAGPAAPGRGGPRAGVRQPRTETVAVPDDRHAPGATLGRPPAASISVR